MLLHLISVSKKAPDVYCSSRKCGPANYFGSSIINEQVITCACINLLLFGGRPFTMKTSFTLSCLVQWKRAHYYLYLLIIFIDINFYISGLFCTPFTVQLSNSFSIDLRVWHFHSFPITRFLLFPFRKKALWRYCHLFALNINFVAYKAQ